jgi:hypothetical protein
MQMRNASENSTRMQVHFTLGAGEVGTCCLGDEAGEPQERRKWEQLRIQTVGPELQVRQPEPELRNCRFPDKGDI